MEKRGCKCKKEGRGHNYMPGRITVTLDGKEVSNRELACRDCAYKKRGDTLSCLRFEEKPDTVLAGGECELYLKDGSDLMGNKSCSPCKGCRG